MRLILIIFVAVIMQAIKCNEPAVVFEEAQPKGVDKKMSIDPIYWGAFLCESDSAIVHITSKVLYKEKAFAFGLSLAEVDSLPNVELIHDYLWVDDWTEKLPATVVGDSVFSEVTFRDTLFDVNKHVLKSYRGHQVLNIPLDKNKWEVQLLSLNYDFNVRLQEAKMPEDLESLEDITPMKDISNDKKKQFLIKPTLLEFSEILSQELIFETCDYYTRLRLDSTI